MKTIWLDATTILSWSRPPVGIVRVEFECAKFALSYPGGWNIQFCRFDFRHGYVAVEPSEVRIAIDRISSPLISAPAGPGQPAMDSTLSRTRFVDVVRSVIQLLPMQVREPLLRYIASHRQSLLAVTSAYGELRRAARLWLNPTAHQSQQQELPPSAPDASAPAPFNFGDAYISLGLDWDLKNFTYLAEIKTRRNVGVLLCCYDIIPAKYPHLMLGDVGPRFIKYFIDLAACADEVLCISECSRRDLLKLLAHVGAPEPPTTVIKLGSDLPFANPDQVAEQVKAAVDCRYILYVSTIEPRKNHQTLYRAYTRLVEQGEENLPKMLFVGMLGWGVNDFLTELQLDQRTRGLIEILTNISDVDLGWLYRNALFTVFPSIYEGWGLGVAESLANGKFCLCSSAGSLPEVGEDLVEYIDPWDIPKWTERLKWYIRHPEEVRRAEDRIKTRYTGPKWQDLARTVFEKAHRLPIREN